MAHQLDLRERLAVPILSDAVDVRWARMSVELTSFRLMQGASMDSLYDERYRVIVELARAGDELSQEGMHADAAAKYVEALKLLPEPASQWEAATWLFTSLGDSHFHRQNWERAYRCFVNAVQSPAGLGNPYVHLRLGQTAFELGDLIRAADELTRAYMGGGMDILLEDDPKYLEFLETKITI